MTNVKDDIAKYLSGELTPAEMHALEKKALYDPFLADALEGGASFSSQEWTADLGQLKSALEGKTRKKGGGGFGWTLPMRVAASVLFLAVSAFIIYSIIDTSTVQKDDPLALNREEPPQEQSSILQDSVAETERVTPAENQPTVPSEKPKEREQSTRIFQLKDTQAERSSTLPEPGLSPVETKDGLMRKDETAGRDVAAAEVAEEELVLDESVTESDGVSNNEDVGRRVEEPISAPALAKKKEATIPVKTIRGKVTDGDDGLPLPGVNVLTKESLVGTTTDLNGNYEITIPQASETLVFSYIGMEVKEIELPESDKDQSQEKIDIQLSPDVSQLSEVVVTGYATEDEQEFEGTKWELAEPVGGRKDYKEYLEKNLLYPQVAIENKVEGKVSVQFTVQPSGQLTDFRVIKSLGFGCDEEVIRLIREGPTWKPTRKNDEPVRGKAKVKMRFSMKDKKK